VGIGHGNFVGLLAAGTGDGNHGNIAAANGAGAW
jgi:hypothetical protein